MLFVQDMELVDQCLRENDYDTDLALVEVLQLMSLGNDDSESFPSCSIWFDLFNHLAHSSTSCPSAAAPGL